MAEVAAGTCIIRLKGNTPVVLAQIIVHLIMLTRKALQPPPELVQHRRR